MEAETESSSSEYWFRNFDALVILRFVLVFFVGVRLLEIIITHYQRPTTKERVTKRYMQANSEVVSKLCEEESDLLKLTLQNTYQNLVPKPILQQARQKKPAKHIKIQDSLNKYYQPVDLDDLTPFPEEAELNPPTPQAESDPSNEKVFKDLIQLQKTEYKVAKEEPVKQD